MFGIVEMFVDKYKSRDKKVPWTVNTLSIPQVSHKAAETWYLSPQNPANHCTSPFPLPKNKNKR